MADPTEAVRRMELNRINSSVESNDQDTERTRLESLYGRVWNTREVSNDFDVLGFMAPYVMVKRKFDGKRGSMEFQHMPRFYFNFMEG
jgi:hypothetical protein